ncbi:hypothetical protein INR49_023761 [Caranx melampygus]|nr:hypothetical protein INR49_023761 [Caranx melampygus]
MAAAVGRVLSFSKNAKVLVSPLRLSAVPAHRYSVEVSSTGEAITHTGQVYDEKDPRRARFVGRQKEDKDTKVGTCGYCGLQFKQKHHH